MSTVHPDPRLVIAVLEEAAALLEKGEEPHDVIYRACVAVGLSNDSVVSQAVFDLEGDRLGETDAWLAHTSNREARLGTFREIARSERDHLVAVAIFCGALAGALDATLRLLVAAYGAGDAEALLILRDHAEVRCLTTDLAQWLPEDERQRWS